MNEKRGNYFLLLGLDPDADIAAIEAKIKEVEKRWQNSAKVAAASKKAEYIRRIEMLPDIKEVMLYNVDKRKKEAKDAVIAAAIDTSKLESAKKALPSSYFTEIEEGLLRLSYTDIYDFLSRNPVKNEIERSFSYNFKTNETKLLDRAKSLMTMYRQLGSEGTDKNGLASKISVFLEEGHKEAHDKYIMMATYAGICEQLNNAVKFLPTISPEVENKTADEFARLFFPRDEVSSFIKSYCTYMEYPLGKPPEPRNEQPNPGEEQTPDPDPYQGWGAEEDKPKRKKSKLLRLIMLAGVAAILYFFVGIETLMSTFEDIDIFNNAVQTITGFFVDNYVEVLETEHGVIRVGDVVSFGNDSWYVLSLNSEDNYAMLIMRDSIGQRAMHNSQTSVSWEQSDLRHYLNNNFYNRFTAEERSHILTATVSNDGILSNTEDAIFLLDSNERGSLFTGENDGRVGSGWWLRTTADGNVASARFLAVGTHRTQGQNVLTHTTDVRPALKLDLTNFPLPMRPYITWDDRRVLVGDSIYFGGHSWRVLALNRDGSALLILNSTLEVRSYHNTAMQITWRESDLREHLNEIFYNGFSVADRALILPTTNHNLDGGGNTVDHVFLLSTDEADELFYNNEARAIGRSWWLRSSTGYSETIGNNGNFNTQRGGNSVIAAHGVRPALRLSVDVGVIGGHGGGLPVFGNDFSHVEQPSMLAGIWTGTFDNELGHGGMTLSVTRIEGGYQAMITYLPIEDSHPDQLASGRKSAFVRFDESTGDLLVRDNEWLEMPQDTGHLGTWEGIAADGVFSGIWQNDGGSGPFFLIKE